MGHALELKACQHREAGGGQLGRVLGHLLTALVGHALHRRGQGLDAAPVLLGEPLSQLRVPQHVRPELEERGQPAVVAALLQAGDEPFHPLVRGLEAVERLLHLLDAAIHAARVDGEEQVLLGREVRVDRALGVPGGIGDGVDGRGVEAPGGEQTVRRVHQVLAGPGLAVGACESRSHTGSI